MTRHDETSDPPTIIVDEALPLPSNDNQLGALITDGFGELIDEASLASRLGVSRSTLQSWRYTGRGPRWIKLGRLIRYRLHDVDAYLAANTHGSAA